MMYSEFVEGTGCKDNKYNYRVFQNLEIMYMNSNMSKAEIYEYGKKLVDNSKSEEEIRFEAEIKSQIDEAKDRIDYYKKEISYRESMIELWKEDNDTYMIDTERRTIKYCKGEIKTLRNEINALKWVLG